jgi:uncharacterized protein YndB with AHSA1/START domain
MTELSPVRREVIVPADPTLAFRVFTERIGTWWPIDRLSVYGDGSSVAFVGDTLVETTPGQPDAVWGSVTVWNPPTSIAFTWHPGTEPDRASRVRVTFTADGERTRVLLEHSGWEGLVDPAQARARYDRGWPGVLDGYLTAVMGNRTSAVMLPS